MKIFISILELLFIMIQIIKLNNYTNTEITTCSITNKLADTNDICLLCLDEINSNNWVMPQNCSCKVKIHSNCFSQITSNGLLCPICRIKSTDVSVNIRINRTVNNNFWLELPMSIFFAYPNLFTFSLWMIYSTLFSLIYILPMLVFHLCQDSKYRNNTIASLMIITSFIIYLFNKD